MASSINFLNSRFFLIAFVAFSAAATGSAQIPPPQPDPSHPNLFYGELNPGVDFETPVLVFVPGLGGTAFNWFSGNDMYEKAYIFGYRTAFISPEPDNSPATGSIEDNAAVLEELIPVVTDHFGVEQVYVIGHSKGGVDLQAAMLNPAIRSRVKALFTISTPNQGTELADWAFSNPELAAPLNLLTPAVEDMQIARMAEFRALVDPVLGPSKNIYTIAGNQFINNILTLITGAILRALAPGLEHETFNDGLVTVARTRIDPSHSSDLGIVPNNHLQTDEGGVVFPKITARIQGNENSYLDEFERIAVNGFAQQGGDESNAWGWSAKWFKGKLYVGTGREPLCVSLLTSDVRTGTDVYEFSFLSGQCPGEIELAQSLGGEIWQYTPETETWKRVYFSPNTIPITINSVEVLTARDNGFRGMTIHKGEDGVERLFAGGVTSGSIYDPDNTGIDTWPGPSLLYTEDGDNWQAVPDDPGTFLGELGNFFLNEQTKVRSYRSMASYKGRLFATVGSYVGSGTIIASPDPTAGNDTWRVVSPPYSELPVWTLRTFGDYLYLTAGFTRAQNPDENGYTLQKTDASGDPPYVFETIIPKGGFQTDPEFIAPNGLSFAEYRDELYLGTNRPTELVRARLDDTWDLIVGEPRQTPTGFKRPLSGFSNGFGSWFNGHFWRMTSHENKLFLGTWDWSVGLQGFSLVAPLDKLFSHAYGFDFFRTPDGVHYTAITQTGLGDPNNSGVRSIESTPAGLFFATARQRHGLEVFRRVGDPEGPLPPPYRLRAESEVTAGRQVNLTWLPSPGAVEYNVYRSTAPGFEQYLDLFFPSGSQEAEGAVADLEREALEEICPLERDAASTPNPCDLLNFVEQVEEEPDLIPASFPLSYQLAGQTTGASFSEPAPTRLQSIYFVRAVAADGSLSMPSNLVGGPSKGPALEFAPCDIDFDGDVDRNDIAQLQEAARETPRGSEDKRDVNSDGVIDVLDSRACALQCDKERCAL